MFFSRWICHRLTNGVAVFFKIKNDNVIILKFTIKKENNKMKTITTFSVALATALLRVGAEIN
jgi:hypothetical protein